ncbi:hypothetical protein Y032_0042g620 [Ancylostoma ceylanicum]|uniref:Uncharacterized protein n=1 Tax=Ancylostoma ceylanicum TaxID=53326 RepID=A0A016UFL4_9BILA|nr:hypothetical protein Y032_0042g620 [Ancylostoma ceylanicum]
MMPNVVCSPARSSSLPAKRGRMEPMSPTPRSSVVDQLQNLAGDGNIPSYMRLVIDMLLDTKREMMEINRRSCEILEENKKLREENFKLMQKIEVLLRPNDVTTNVSAQHPESDYNSVVEDSERLRSVVLSGVPESNANSSVERAHHDMICIHQILDFLNVECLPSAVYRMGRYDASKHRLLKVVLPASKYQKEAIRRAPRLRFFPHKGVYLRPSLTKEERNRRRLERQKDAALVRDPGSRPSVSPTANSCPDTSSIALDVFNTQASNASSGNH